MTQEKTLSNSVSKNDSHIAESKRIATIDRFRGLAIFCMIFFQFLAHFPSLGILAKISSHNLSTGIVILNHMTIADIIAPMFMFAIGITYKMSFDKRVLLYGKDAAVKHMVSRYLALIGIGTFLLGVNLFLDYAGGDVLSNVDWYFVILTFVAIAVLLLALIFKLIKPWKKVSHVVNKILLYVFIILGISAFLLSIRDFAVLNQASGEAVYNYWMVLQSIGWAGLIALPFMNKDVKKRSIAFFALLALYIIYYEMGNDALMDAVTQGGFIGGFGWALIIIAASILTEIYVKSKKRFMLTILASTPIVVLVYLTMLINKGAVSPAYVIISTYICALAFLFIDLFQFYRYKFDPLSWWGRYPILMYLLEFFFVGSLTTFLPESLTTNAPWWVAVIIVTVVMVLLTLVNYFLIKRKRKINV